MAESTLPIRKRRRPALSCVECRRRRIKCDRNDPCNHCKKLSGIKCNYTTSQVASTRHVPSSSKPEQPFGDISNLEVLEQEVIDGSRLVSANNEVLFSATASALGSAPFTDYTTESNRGQDSVTVLSSKNTEKGQTPSNVGIHAGDINTITSKIDISKNDISTYIVRKNNNVFTQDDIGDAKIRTKFSIANESGLEKESQELSIKTCFTGPSSWKHSLEQLLKTLSNRSAFMFCCPPETKQSDPESSEEIRIALEECKNIARAAKAETAISWHMDADLKDCFPVRDVADKLVQNYFRTMEGTYRILHIPSFYREYENYWLNPQSALTSSIVKILLVMAIGTTFHQEEDYRLLRVKAIQWVYSSQGWIFGPDEKGRLTLSGLQVYCLLLLARQAIAIGGDMIWVTAGSLLRSAFRMGLHRDPMHYKRMSPMQGELRRRLWATILELTIQTSMDSGMPPLISSNDYDTEAPSNINDEDISEKGSSLPTVKPVNIFTQTSLQIQLIKSSHLRLHILQAINDFHSQLSYDAVLKFGNELTAACKEFSQLINGYFPPYPIPTALQRNLVDMLVRRFLFALHRSFALKARTNSRFYFSRKICLDTALVIITHPTCLPGESPPTIGKMDDYTRLRTVVGGPFKDIIYYSGIIICLEINAQLEEEQAAGLPSSISGKSLRAPLHQCVNEVADIMRMRIMLYENNIKEYLLLRAVMAQNDAMEKGTGGSEEIMETTLTEARRCLELVKSRIKPPKPFPSTEIQSLAEGIAADAVLSDQDFSYDFVMQDAGPEFTFDISDNWLLSGWDDNNEW